MSVSVEQPLHFSQQPSSPSFSSPPHSPAQRLHAQTPASPPPPPPADVDMSAAVTTLPPAGQQHDREDANMEDGLGLTNGRVPESRGLSNNGDAVNDTVAIEVAAVDADAMDTTPDTDTELVLPNSSTDPLEAATTPTSPPVNEAPAPEPSNDETPPTVPTGDETQGDGVVPPEPPFVDPSLDPNLQPPPPPPPIEPVRSDSESSDDDDGLQPWHPIQEDTSSPDEDELKEIEATTEHSALDHDHWESKAFLPLEQPEYTVGQTGRIDWSIDAYNGTREKPNRDIVMTSDVVTVGGHQWQIKFYPKGNDSDYLSVYLECLSVMDPKKKTDVDQDGEASKDAAVSQIDAQEQDKMETAEHVAAASPSSPVTPVDPQHAPLPLLGSKTVTKRKSVAAQVSVVLYNPTEPRVHYSRTALHRFCSGSPDWGWTRFHGPYYDIAHRLRGHRAALLQNDKLAFTGYIRIVEDETNCLWEHPNRDNPWDSFAMTGLQSLVLGENASAPGGNMISAVASWLIFKPFRDLLYAINVPDPEVDQFARPKPLVTALQKVLYMLRTQVDPGAGPVALDDVLDALEWYGIHKRLDKLDVIEIWRLLRAKLEDELRGTAHAETLESLFGPKRDYTTGVPICRVPVVGIETMQAAVDSLTDLALFGQPLPQLLTIELDRQDFDVKTRSYVKVLNKVTLDDRLTIDNTSYTLFGFVVHKQTLQSYVYQPIIRPEGPDSRWYSYSDSKEENQVKCLTKREAIDDHEGKPGKEQIVGNDAVAYVAMYVRDDITHATFAADPDAEHWDVPGWLRAEVESEKSSAVPPPMPPLPTDTTAIKDNAEHEINTQEKEEPTAVLDFQVVDSRVFNAHEGPGNFDAYDAKWTSSTTEHIHSIQLASNSSCPEIVDSLVPLFPDVKDPRQIIFWFLEPSRGILSRPQFLSTGKMLYSRETYDRYAENRNWTLTDLPYASRRLWVHVIDFADLPEPPPAEEEQKQEEAEPVTDQAAPVSSVADEMQSDSNIVPSEEPVLLSSEPARAEDTPMSEPEDLTVAPVEPQAPESDAPPSAEVVEIIDTTMVEVESAEVSDPPPVDVLVPDAPTMPGDTEMGGTQDQEDLTLPQPPPASILANIPPPPERVRTPTPPPDEIYFFLKLWNTEKQILESRGSHVCLMSARVDETVVKLLGLPIEDKKKIELWEEEEPIGARPIKHRRSFVQLDMRNTSIVIASMPATAEQRAALADRAAFVEPSAYLTYCALARNFPSSINGHFTYRNFSSQYYKGEVKNGERHGHGMLMYHSGATYSGSFRLGQCHGHGLYTFQNGDTYDGDWVDNQRHGSGTFVEAATGNTYVGGWKNDKKFGEGVTHWKNAQEAERMCRICWDEPAEAAFYDCGHVVACLTCAREVQNCPVCRKRVLSAMKLYYVA